MARILVIDDDQTARALIKIMLQSAGHEVREAAEGGEGRWIHQQWPCEVVVLEVFLPGQNGLQTLLGLRTNDPSIGVIAISGGERSSDEAQGALGIMKRFGALSTLTKPFSQSELLTAVETALKKHSEDWDQSL